MSEETFVGRRFAHYRVLERIGAGGMGVVYRAHDETLDREVVLKLLPDDAIGDAAARSRLLDEARKAAALNHPNICTIHEVGESEGQVYIAMERVDGQPLKERVGSSGLPGATALSLGIQIADALAHAHDRGIVHRDLKSANVVVTPEGRAKVLDFGIARRVDPASQATVPGRTAPATGAMAGTAHYLPPEAFRGERVDARGDVWALGVLLHEMLTGRLPFAGNTEVELGAAILNADPAPFPAGVPAGLRSVVQRCLQKDPAARFQRASEVRAVLEMVRGEGAGAASPARVVVGPRGARRPSLLLATAAVAVLIVTVIAIGMALRGRRASGPGAIRSLAVLPLENLSGNPEQEYFADGMTEELITSLANLEGVSVISRTSTMQYKGTKKTVPEIARELGVDGVVEGSALRAGDRVRITAQLIDAARDRHVWARSYERDVKEVLALQAEVAAAIAGEIRAALSESGKSRATHTRAVDPQAYEDYLKGRFYWAKRNPDSFRRAEEFFRRAIARDPNYAAPYAGLADVYAVRGDYGGIPPSGIYPIAREAVLRALELDDQLAEAHAALGTIRYKFEHDLAGAGSELRRALTLNPSYATAHQWYGGYLAWSGKPSEALAELDRAQELDPLAPVIRWNRANILLNQRRYDEAAAAARQALELDPGAAPAHLSLARIHLASKNYAGALAEFDQSDSINAAIHRDPAIRAALSRGDERAYWSLLLRSAKGRAARSYVSPTTFAGLYARLGERDSALVWLVRAFDGLDAGLFPSIRGLAFDSLRSDPRYVAILKQHGLEP